MTVENVECIYEPYPKQAAFHASPAKYRAMVGGFGSGKTSALLMEALRYCLDVPGSNSIILRRTYPALERSIINLFLSKVPREAYGSYNSSQHVANFSNGSKLYFGYAENDADLNQYLSTEFVFIGIEEAGEFSFSSWLALTGRNRCPVKVDVNGDAVMPSMALATNPFGAGYGWIKALFVKKQPYGGMTNYNSADYELFHSTVFDNPTYAGDANYMASLEQLPEAEKKKKLYGDLETVSGAYFSNFDPTPGRGQVVRYGDIQFKPWHPRWIGEDWGFAHANAVFWMAKAEIPSPLPGEGNGYRLTTVIYRELVEYEKSHREMAALIRSKMSEGEQVLNLFLSPERFARREDHRTIAEQYGDELLKVGLPRPIRADNDREGGWRLMYNLFAQSDLVIADTCPQLIEAMQLVTRDPDNIEDVLKVEGVADDCAEGARYGVKSYLSPGKKPQDVELDELLRTKESNTARFMAQQRFEQDHKGASDIVVNVPRRKLR